MPLKAGKYEVEFKFEPVSYSLGNTIALISSIILVLSLLGFAFLQWKNQNNNLIKIQDFMRKNNHNKTKEKIQKHPYKLHFKHVACFVSGGLG